MNVVGRLCTHTYSLIICEKTIRAKFLRYVIKFIHMKLDMTEIYSEFGNDYLHIISISGKSKRLRNGN